MELDNNLIGITAVVVAFLTVLVTIHHRNSRSPDRLAIQLNMSAEANSNGIGTHLAALVTISNHGKNPIFFGGFHAYDSDNEMYYPSCSIKGGAKLEAGEYVQGTIPAGHLIKPLVNQLWAIDGRGNKYHVNKSVLKQFIAELKLEKLRLKSLGLR